ncbi:MAG: hypothetical protein SFU87_12705 [Chitinophagaceae bacterium]|nr:hypothetical protein [Chitinophagaceae bacterium]
MKHQMSEKYRKYLVKLILDKKVYYCIWGTDMSDDCETDFILLNKEKKIVLFEKLININKRIMAYRRHFFDKKNFYTWVNENSFSKSYSTIDIDILQIDSISTFGIFLKNKTNALKFIDTINFIRDFAEQTRNNELLRRLKNQYIKKTWDFIYNRYFWQSRRKSGDMILQTPNLRKVDLLNLLSIHTSFSNSLIINKVHTS